MTGIALRPNETIEAGGTVVGFATLDSALADDTDTTYVAMDSGDEFTVGFDDAFLTPDAVVRRLFVWLRLWGAAGDDPGPTARARLAVGGEEVTTRTVVWWSSPVTYTGVLIAELSPSVAELDDAELTIHDEPDAPPTARATLILSEAYLVAIVVPRPAVDVIDPAGTLTDTDLATVTWTDTLDSDGGEQAAYEVKIFDGATVLGGGFDPDTSGAVQESGILGGADGSYSFTEPLADGSYAAFVRVAQSVGETDLWSDWAASSFSVDTDRPALPAISLEAENGSGRMRINLTAGGGGAATTDEFEVERSDDEGATFAAIRTVEGAGMVLVGDDSAWDLEAPNGVLVTYRARAVHQNPGGLTHSAWVEAVGAWESTDWWLKHPTLPDLNVAIPRMRIDSEPGKARAARQGTFQPLGRTDPIVVADVRGPWTGTLRFESTTEALQAALDALLDEGSPILVQAPADDHWPDRWVAVGDLTRERVVDKLAAEPVFDSLPWTEIARPTDDYEVWPGPPLAAPPDDLIFL